MEWYEILWQLPQWIIGWIYFKLKFYNIDDGFLYNDAAYYIVLGQKGSVTFCRDFIFLSDYSRNSDYTIKHEYGHTVQSRYLGWLYLPIIGLPSIIWAFIHSNFCRKKSYYKFYTEKWANKLGGNLVV